MENGLPPFISVIIPTYERPARLLRCLSALETQDFPPDRFEVLVVDDGGATPLTGLIDSLRHRLNVTLLRQPHAGPATARNYGASHARGSYFAFTDDDCTPAPDWLLRLSASFTQFPECVLGGRTVNELAGNPYSTASQLLVDFLYACWNPTTQEATFFASNNLALSAKCFNSVGGFDVQWDRAAGEDRDLCDRLLGHGYRLIYVSDAVVHHAHSLTFRSFCRQHFNYGWGAHRLHKLRAKRTGNHVQFASLTFYLRAAVYPFRQHTPVRKTGLVALLLGVAQAANTVGWVAAALNKIGTGLSTHDKAFEIRRDRNIEDTSMLRANQRRSSVMVSVKRMLKFLGRA